MTSGKVDPYSDTLEVYEKRAREWFEQRSADTGFIEDFVRDLDSTPDGAVVDLGCGPGWHLGALPAGTIALDGALGMLEVVSEVSPGSPLMQADLRSLPFARGSLRGVWANKAYVHVARSDTPMALRELHRCMKVGGIAHMSFFGGDEEHAGYDEDDFGGRSFSLWPTGLLHDVVAGAGFSVESYAESDPQKGKPFLALRVRRERTLADSVAADMALLLVGLNPSLHAADSGVGFSGPSNRGWPALEKAGLGVGASRSPERLLGEHRVGMTDMVKRATRSAKELTKDDYRDGIARLDRLCAWLKPAAVCVIGLSGWRSAVDRHAREGVQPQTLGDRPVYLMPNPSGLNAHTNADELAQHLRRALELGTTGANRGHVVR